jgi:uncharacterized membrane protein
MKWEEAEIEALVGRLLRAGIMVAAVFLLAGVGLELRRGLDAFPLGGEFPFGLRAVLWGAMAGDPQAVIGLGLLALIATPLARLFLLLALFVHQRDRAYAAICLLLIVMLGLGGLLGGSAR